MRSSTARLEMIEAGSRLTRVLDVRSDVSLSDDDAREVSALVNRYLLALTRYREVVEMAMVNKRVAGQGVTSSGGTETRRSR